VHGDNARHHAGEKPDRVIAAEQRVRRVVLDPERRRIDPLQDLEKDIRRLRKFRIAPGPVFVMVLQTEHGAAAFGIVN
jgi:hypothetical protein